MKSVGNFFKIITKISNLSRVFEKNQLLKIRYKITEISKDPCCIKEINGNSMKNLLQINLIN